ncbi:lytic transglycosylase domain-containing protein [Nocardioides speluncae]|uniref:lytic transglycosylase domain-containing protein n=1 Tax=Nocardioides speluncae TaxID=2670337 RepID=UPI001F0C3772|nr:lytic transglycosylase domain-containing protein [Nocardioides speluncae]
MASSRSMWIDKATAVVPLVALSTFCAFGLTGSGVSVVSANIRPKPPTAPAPGTVVPDQPLDVPASESDLDPGISAAPPGLRGQPISATSVSPTDIPTPALAAYQRAATVINHADKSCKLPWELLAAIGRVESHHGTYGGSRLDANGVARPSIIGIALDGNRNTSRILDTDRGKLDGDTVHDRAVGPMQFIPSTWSAVGVDADGDKLRNPQDVDDAALGAAVYLCAGSGSLAKPEGQRTAVLRYNHSDEYADVVLALLEAYQSGDYGTTPPSATPQPGDPVPAHWNPTPAEEQVDLIVQAVHQVQEENPDLVAEPVVPPDTHEPSDPHPTDPTDPTQPTKPPIDPANPGEPTVPPVPTDPSEPSDPSSPTAPTDPTDTPTESPTSPPASPSPSPSPSPTGEDRAVSGTLTGDLLARLDEAARADLLAVLAGASAADAEAAETTCFSAATEPYDDAALATCLADLLAQPAQP